MTDECAEVELAADLSKPVILKFHPLIRIAHWSNVFILIALILSGLSIYWASPVFEFHTPEKKIEPFTLLGQCFLSLTHDHQESARNWFFNHFALGAGNLAYALNVHWLFAYLFMFSTVLYLTGSLRAGSLRALLPVPSDLHESVRMLLYYIRAVPFLILRLQNPHPQTSRKYNALQRCAYFLSLLVSLMAIVTGWALHKPSQLWLLQMACGGYDCARVLHFVAVPFFVFFVVPHVVLVVLTGWDCFRSMVVGWSENIECHDART